LPSQGSPEETPVPRMCSVSQYFLLRTPTSLGGRTLNQTFTADGWSAEKVGDFLSLAVAGTASSVGSGDSDFK
jgi:hypothetical protein